MKYTGTKPIKVLLVEDEPIATMVLSKMLEEVGCTLHVAVNGKQALAMSSKSYDIIFMDIGLPDLSGINVSNEIRRREHTDEKRAYIIALSGFVIDDIRDQCFEAGMDQVASKPITIEKLQTLLNCFIKYITSHLNLRQQAGFGLTNREKEVSTYIITGKSAREIAKLLNLSVRTIETHVSNMKHKLNCYKKSELVEKLLQVNESDR